MRDAAWLIAFCLVSTLGAGVGLAFAGLGAGVEFGTSLTQLAYAIGHGLAMGVGAALLSRVEDRLSGWRGRALWAVVGGLLAALVLPADLGPLSQKFGASVGVAPGLFVAGVVLLVAGGVASLGPLATRWPRVAALAGLGVTVVHPVVFRAGYPGLHLLAALEAGLLMGIVLGPRARAWPRPARVRVWKVSVLTLALASAIVPAPNAMRVTAKQNAGLFVFPFTARLVGPPVGAGFEGGGSGEWMQDRRALAEVPASETRPMGEVGLVLMVSIDALRADVLAHPEARQAVPSLAKLADEGLDFEMARSPGASTVYSLGSLFSGEYFSGLLWTRRSHAGTNDLWPHEDETPRFVATLNAAGVQTWTFAPTFWLSNEFGIVRGFSESSFEEMGESIAPRGASHWNSASHLVDTFFSRLDRRAGAGEDGGVFAFLHFLEPHAPYDLGGTQGPDRARYLAELTLADAQLSRLIQGLEERGLWSNTVLIATSDHGEAFGEHGTRLHATTLYEEQLRVPLVMRGPGVAARSESTPVTLMDLGPTVLDLFGVAAPGHHLGQSLAPALVGEPLRLSRPIAAEGRHMRALVFPDGFKLIHDLDTQGTELYDLRSDPRELQNLFDASDPEHRARLAALVTFFAAHEFRAPGYSLPLRK